MVMKKLVVYYSLSGNTQFIAENIADEIRADILRLRPKREIDPGSLWRYLWGGKQVVMKEKPELLPLDKNPQDYEVLFIGTPVWAFNYSPPLRTFLDLCAGMRLKSKKIALFCCYGGLKGNVFGNMKKALSGNEILGKKGFFEPLMFNEELNAIKARKWAKEIVKKAGE